ncbi:hypothetical protein F5888DRAFT_83251 [Russula emetica]|nr:hypothetical protein F5888DRAFT_83251 [Russula emetica]
MCTYPNQYYPFPSYPAWGPQSTPCEPPPPTSLSTMALQDIVEGQQRAMNGLGSLLSQERASNERSTRDNKQQLTNLATLSQNLLGFMPDVEQKFSALDSFIRGNYTIADDPELQDRVNDMVQVITNLRRIAESFACSTGLRLVPGPAPDQWAWVPTSTGTPPLQQDHTSFSTTFPQAPHIFPTAIPNSTRSSVFAHSNPARSVHWPSDLDAPPTSCSTPWSDPYSSGPYGAGNTASAFSRISLGGVRGLTSPTTIRVPPSYMTSTLSDQSSPLIPMTDRFGPPPAPTPQMPVGRRSRSLSIPVMESPHVQRTASSPQPASTPCQTASVESVVGSLRRAQLSPISESRTPSPAVPPLPAFGCTPLGRPSPSTSTIETISTPSGPIPPPLNAPQASLLTTSRVRSDLAVPNDPTRQSLFDMINLSEPSSNASSPPRVEIPSSRSVETIRWSSLFPSAPVLVSPPLLSSVSSSFTLSSPSVSPSQPIICYPDSPGLSSPSEPMTPLSRVSRESTPGALLTKLTTDIVGSPKASDDPVLSSVTATSVGSLAQVGPSTSNTSSNSSLPRNQLAIQLVSFFFESIQRIFKVPASVDLSYKGFEVSFSTDSVPWKDTSVVDVFSDEDGEHDRTFEIMPAPSNAALHRYIRDLARVRMDLAVMLAGGNESRDQAVVQLELRVKAEQEATQCWVKRVCKAAGALSIVDPAFSPRK